MERFCVSHDCHRLGCDVEMVQSNVGEWVGYDDASAEIAKLRAEVDSLRSDRDDVIRRNAQLAGDTVPLDEAIAHLASYCHARGYTEDCAAMQQPGSRSKFAATLWRVLGNAHADRRFLLSELDAARAALDGERAKCDEAKWFIEYLSATNDGQRADAEAWLFGYRARRAAEAQPKE